MVSESGIYSLDDTRRLHDKIHEPRGMTHPALNGADMIMGEHS